MCFNIMSLDQLSKFGDLEKIGEGTYGVVFKGIHKKSGLKVALKKIRLETDGEGVPSTCIREITLLKDLNHTNIVRLYDVIHNGDRLFLIFEFVDRDLKGLLDLLPEKKLPPQHFRLATSSGYRILSYKAVDANGIIKLADFGLARNFSMPSRPYTHEVVTLWYRAPEVLLGGRYYCTGLDIWSLGCIFIEMASGGTPFQGDSEIDQLFKIFKLLGTPSTEIWPEVDLLPNFKHVFPKWKVEDDNLKRTMGPLEDDGVALARDMLSYHPESRITAKSALGHRYLRNLSFAPPEVVSLLKEAITEPKANHSNY
ncbi:unnamed protein product [Auanema sp. JU1783]|nr:unnamed protein product [Auanema sp. JU1783]